MYKVYQDETLLTIVEDFPSALKLARKHQVKTIDQYFIVYCPKTDRGSETTWKLWADGKLEYEGS